MAQPAAPGTAQLLRGVRLTGVKCHRVLEWSLPKDAPSAGWHVFLGENGAGKTALLRAIVVGALESNVAAALREDLSGWVSLGMEKARVELKGENGSRTHVSWTREGAMERVRQGWAVVGAPLLGYGPYRRFGEGGEEESELQRIPTAARVATLFSPRFVLPSGTQWLRDLHVSELESGFGGSSGPAYSGGAGSGAGVSDGNGYRHGAASGSGSGSGDEAVPASRPTVAAVREFVNSAGLLPHGVRLGRVDARGVYFDSGATALPFAALSDGYRTVLSLVLDLLRQLGGASSPSVAATVLIDEVDVHLHPTWQRTIGPTLCRLFPTVQFLVTTHSPLACHAAASGTIFRLPTPGSDETGVFLEGIARDRLLYGDIGEAFGTGAFGPGVTRSDEGRRLARELAELNVRALEGPLTKEQEGRRKRLREMLPSGRKS